MKYKNGSQRKNLLRIHTDLHQVKYIYTIVLVFIYWLI